MPGSFYYLAKRKYLSKNHFAIFLSCSIFLAIFFQVNLTEDQILALAPDEASKKAGKELANPSKWISKGASEQALWGECQGSGSKPYQTQIDLNNTAFKCSCPSRKFPCKHGIALGLLYARQPNIFTEKESPAWVAEWIGKRAQKEEKKAEKTEKPVDEAAQAKRQQAREKKVAEGIEELLIWIKDIVRHGIINIPDKGYAYWEGMAKRMVDAQSPGLAGMVKALGSTNFFKEGWQSTFVDKLLDVYLIAKGYQNKESLDTLVLQDIRNWIGFTISQDELKQQQGVFDTWLVLGKQITEDDNLTVERNWLYGTTSNRYALVLQFIIRGQGATVLLSPGMFIEAELVYYSSASPLRASVKRQVTSSPSIPKQLFTSWKEVAQEETSICSNFPVRSERPYIISEILLVQYNGGWWLKDKNNDMVAIKEDFAGIWKLLAISGGYPLNMVVVGKERLYQPLGVWHNQNYKVI